MIIMWSNNNDVGSKTEWSDVDDISNGIDPLSPGKMCVSVRTCVDVCTYTFGQ